MTVNSAQQIKGCSKVSKNGYEFKKARAKVEVAACFPASEDSGARHATPFQRKMGEGVCNPPVPLE